MHASGYACLLLCSSFYCQEAEPPSVHSLESHFVQGFLPHAFFYLKKAENESHPNGRDLSGRCFTSFLSAVAQKHNLIFLLRELSSLKICVANPTQSLSVVGAMQMSVAWGEGFSTTFPHASQTKSSRKWPGVNVPSGPAYFHLFLAL